MVRLFTAIEIPLSAARALERLRGGVPGARWVEPENYHVTLSFIGEVEKPLAREIDASLAEVDAPSFELSLEGVGSFGRSPPRSIWAGVERVPELAALQADTARAIARLGVRLESRKFTPHVTLARLRQSDEAALAGYLSRHALFRTRHFVVDRFVLMSSRPSKGGGPYAIEDAFPLEGRPVAQWSGS